MTEVETPEAEDSALFTAVAKAKKPELVKAAEYFGVEFEEKENVTVIRAKLVEEGIDDEVYAGWVKELEAKAKAEAEVKTEEKKASNQTGGSISEPKQEEDTILVKMNRKNPLMIIRGYRFTTADPFRVVPVKDAEFIIHKYKGFSQAMPSEVKEYFG